MSGKRNMLFKIESVKEIEERNIGLRNRRVDMEVEVTGDEKLRRGE